ncbi:hypothetical protein JOM56_000476 [Amanita muscaria]
MPRRPKAHLSWSQNFRNADQQQDKSKNDSEMAGDHNDDDVIMEEHPTQPFLEEGIIAQDQADDIFESETSADDSDDNSHTNVQAAATQLATFSATLARAQREAEKVERERRAQNKRPCFYTGDSECTKRRRRQEKREMEEKGYRSITSYFKPFGASGSGDREPECALDAEEWLDDEAGEVEEAEAKEVEEEEAEEIEEAEAEDPSLTGLEIMLSARK